MVAVVCMWKGEFCSWSKRRYQPARSVQGRYGEHPPWRLQQAIAAAELQRNSAPGWAWRLTSVQVVAEGLSFVGEEALVRVVTMMERRCE